MLVYRKRLRCPQKRNCATNGALLLQIAANTHPVQIPTPGLAIGVHVNGRGGSSSAFCFPINTAPGCVMMYEMIDPMRSVSHITALAGEPPLTL